MQGMSEIWVPSLGWDDLGILPWKIPWTEEPCGLESMGLQRVEHDRSY